MKISTAGRICFFGEHQDYLGLPVIAAAISRRIAVSGTKRTDDQIVIAMPDIDQIEQFSLSDIFPYKRERDYFRSIIHVLRKRGFEFSVGFDCEVQGNIPINSGTSSSSALNVSWANFLVRMADNPAELSTKTLGEIAYEAEVLEFGEPGGMMDQYSTAIGNVIYLESTPEIHVEALQPNLGTFVLGDSQQPKDTLGILARCRYGMEAIIEKVKHYDPTFSIFTTPADKSPEYKAVLTADEWGLFNANVNDRDILRAGKAILSEQNIDHKAFGRLLYEHHQNLRDYKKTSTTKIDRMIESALGSGALGAKINGSGGGGCMYAYAPTNPEAVAEAIEREGGKAYIISVDGGTRVED